MSLIHSLFPSHHHSISSTSDAEPLKTKSTQAETVDTSAHLQAKRSPIDKMMAKFHGERMAYELNLQVGDKKGGEQTTKGSEAEALKPVLNEDYQRQFKTHLTLFKDIAAICDALEQQGEPFSKQQNLQRQELNTTIDKLESMAPLLLHGVRGDNENLSKNSLADVKAMAQYAKQDVLSERNVVALLQEKPRKILPLINNMDSLSLLSKYVKDQMSSLAGSLRKQSPEVIHFLAQRKQELDQRTDKSLSEAGVQQNISQLLSSAVEGFNQATLDSHSHGGRGWLAKHAKALHHLGFHVKTPDEFRTKIKDHIESEYGRLFQVEINKDKTLSVHVNENTIGALPTKDFVRGLDDIYHMMTKNYDKTTVKEAIKASDDVEWRKGAGGEKVLSLTDKAEQALKEAHAIDELAPQSKLQSSIMRGVNDLKLSHLKVGLQQSFQQRANDIKKSADSWLNLDSKVAAGKALIVDSLMKDLMDSESPQDMLNLTHTAFDMNNQLCDSSPLIRNSGKTGELINDLYHAISRFMSE